MGQSCLRAISVPSSNVPQRDEFQGNTFENFAVCHSRQLNCQLHPLPVLLSNQPVNEYFGPFDVVRVSYSTLYPGTWYSHN